MCPYSNRSGKKQVTADDEQEGPRQRATSHPSSPFIGQVTLVKGDYPNHGKGFMDLT